MEPATAKTPVNTGDFGAPNIPNDFPGLPVKVSDGIRTRDRRDHNPELYRLSYAHQAASSLAPGSAAHEVFGERQALARRLIGVAL